LGGFRWFWLVSYFSNTLCC